MIFLVYQMDDMFYWTFNAWTHYRFYEWRLALFCEKFASTMRWSAVCDIQRRHVISWRYR